MAAQARARTPAGAAGALPAAPPRMQGPSRRRRTLVGEARAGGAPVAAARPLFVGLCWALSPPPPRLAASAGWPPGSGHTRP